MAQRTINRPALPGVDVYFTVREAAAHLGLGEQRFLSIVKKYNVPILVLEDSQKKVIKRIRQTDLRMLLDRNMYSVAG